SDFHVFRALHVGKKWGIPDIYGISCESDPILFGHFCVRECAAILKDKLVGNM
ncbi:MAG TPA: YdcF family protein, partial [Lachnoclostridium sp.]|nr:YdcF family protein [Lachnoclostridium sp.]